MPGSKRTEKDMRLEDVLSYLKEAVARQWREEYGFATSGDPEMDGPDYWNGPVGEGKATKSKRRLRKERQQERRQQANARRHNIQRG